MRDYTIRFYEKETDYKFDRIFSTLTKQKHLQCRIWCIQSRMVWLTTDKTNSLYVWDKDVEESLTLEHAHNAKVMDVLEIAKIEAFLTSSLDKKLIVWDVKTFEKRFTIDIRKSFSVHTIRYSVTFDVS